MRWPRGEPAEAEASLVGHPQTPVSSHSQTPIPEPQQTPTIFFYLPPNRFGMLFSTCIFYQAMFEHAVFFVFFFVFLSSFNTCPPHLATSFPEVPPCFAVHLCRYSALPPLLLCFVTAVSPTALYPPSALLQKGCEQMRPLFMYPLATHETSFFELLAISPLQCYCYCCSLQ